MEPNTQPASQTTTEVSYVGLISAIVILLIAIAGVAWYIYTGMQNTPAEQVAVEPETQEMPAAEPGPLSAQERAAVLNSMQVNPDNLSVEERRAVLDEL